MSLVKHRYHKYTKQLPQKYHEFHTDFINLFAILVHKFIGHVYQRDYYNKKVKFLKEKFVYDQISIDRFSEIQTELNEKIKKIYQAEEYMQYVRKYMYEIIEFFDLVPVTRDYKNIVKVIIEKYKHNRPIRKSNKINYDALRQLGYI